MSLALALTAPVLRQRRLTPTVTSWRCVRSSPRTRMRCLCCGKITPPWKRPTKSLVCAISQVRSTTPAILAAFTPANGSGRRFCTSPVRIAPSRRPPSRGLNCVTGCRRCFPAPLARKISAVAAAAPGTKHCGMKAGAVCRPRASLMNSIRALTVICATRYLAKPSPPICPWAPCAPNGRSASACRKAW